MFLPGESQGEWGAWRAAIYGVAQSWTRLTRRSSSSSRPIDIPLLPPAPIVTDEKTDTERLSDSLKITQLLSVRPGTKSQAS